jgi:hypothetical protein
MLTFAGWKKFMRRELQESKDKHAGASVEFCDDQQGDMLWKASRLSSNLLFVLEQIPHSISDRRWSHLQLLRALL